MGIIAQGLLGGLCAIMQINQWAPCLVHSRHEAVFAGVLCFYHSLLEHTKIRVMTLQGAGTIRTQTSCVNAQGTQSQTVPRASLPGNWKGTAREREKARRGTCWLIQTRSHNAVTCQPRGWKPHPASVHMAWGTISWLLNPSIFDKNSAVFIILNAKVFTKKDLQWTLNCVIKMSQHLLQMLVPLA